MSNSVRELIAKATGSAATARTLRFPTDSDGDGAEPAERWSLAGLSGRLVEISARGATATLTTAVDLVLEAQLDDQPVAWMTLGDVMFFPPDLADSGIDLAALVVVRVADASAAARAAERLLRSGGFGLVVLDFCSGGAGVLPMAHQGRLVTLAQTHHAAVVCITEKPSDAASLGSLVSLRAEALRLAERDGGVAVRVIKDKRHGPGWSHLLKLRA
jgi:recombination protein RecA